MPSNVLTSLRAILARSLAIPPTTIAATVIPAFQHLPGSKYLLLFDDLRQPCVRSSRLQPMILHSHGKH